jgi:hypothetical protein
VPGDLQTTNASITNKADFKSASGALLEILPPIVPAFLTSGLPTMAAANLRAEFRRGKSELRAI